MQETPVAPHWKGLLMCSDDGGRNLHGLPSPPSPPNASVRAVLGGKPAQG